ncbi:MAG: calcium-translocating P-type ATPase, PMCA-type [Lachnoclostridium sp.]|nr:calcium-translocating P-type ATPase, PMCA-type [Lachnoclostridium sp.]
MSNRQYSGLSDAEVLESRSRHGINILTPPVKRSVWLQLLDKFRDPLIIILLVAGLLSIGISIYEYTALNESASVFLEPVGIFIAVFLATVLAFIFEQKAEREFSILNKVNDDEPVEVYRNGKLTNVPRRDIVVGDIVVLSTGQEIPADGVILESVSLNVDESTLTGEPICHKSALPEEADPEATFPTDHLLRGTKVMEGHGIYKVTAVGDMTENGKVYEASHIDDNIVTPLDSQLNRLSVYITRASYVIAIAIVIGRVLMYFIDPDPARDNYDFNLVNFMTYLLQTFMLAVALIVVSVPEGLPMAVTLSLAYSMRRMLKSNNLVRKLHACETMGATTVICTDKTGTLTRNRMTVYHLDILTDKDGAEGARLIRNNIAVNSTAELEINDDYGKISVLGNPTEGALLLWLHDSGVDYRILKQQSVIVDELPFTTERKYMATLVDDADGRRILYVKGAPEIVLGMCKGSANSSLRKEIDSSLAEYQDQGMRTLGFASLNCSSSISSISQLNLKDLDFLGIAAISDPVREDVPSAVEECFKAGIDIKIVTGDTPATAREIGRQIGLWLPEDGDENIITGPEFAALSDQELRRRIKKIKIIARARPMDKKRLVETLRDLDEVVAVTGDGTNDAPALKAAHVGLSMGDGTSVAKEASDITIIDNSFTSIGKAVMWGRSLYINLQRFIGFQLTVNVVACLVVLVSSYMGTESPLTVTQMLWVNLIMDTFAALALSTLPPTHDVMNRQPRRRDSFIIAPSMWRNILGAGLTFFAILIILIYIFEHTEITSLTQLTHLHLGSEGNLSPYELTLLFTIFVMLQIWNIFNSRAYDSNHTAFNLKDCGEFIFVVLVIIIGQVIIVNFGNAFFNTVPLKLTDWIIIIVATSPVLLVGESYRYIKRHILK